MKRSEITCQPRGRWRKQPKKRLTRAGRPSQEGLLQQLGNGSSLLRIEPQAALESREQVGPDVELVLAQVFASLPDRDRVFGEADPRRRARDGRDLDGNVAEVGERRASVDHLVQDAAERPDVRRATELHRSKGEREVGQQVYASHGVQSRLTFIRRFPPRPRPVSLRASGGI